MDSVVRPPPSLVAGGTHAMLVRRIARQLSGRPHSLALAARPLQHTLLVPPPSSLSLLQHERGYKYVKGKHAPRVGEAKRAERQCAAARALARSHSSRD